MNGMANNKWIKVRHSDQMPKTRLGVDFMYDGHLACMAVPACKGTIARGTQHVARVFTSHQWLGFIPSGLWKDQCTPRGQTK